MYKAGDEVLIKAKVIYCDDSNIPYMIETKSERKFFISDNDLEPVGKTYAQGLADAWELTKKISAMGNDNRDSAFGYSTIPRVMEMYTAEEALAKIEVYEQEKEIKVGDEVIHETDSTKHQFVVTYIGGNMISGIEKNGDTHGFSFPNQYIRKTGKHIDIELLLRQIGE